MDSFSKGFENSLTKAPYADSINNNTNEFTKNIERFTKQIDNKFLESNITEADETAKTMDGVNHELRKTHAEESMIKSIKTPMTENKLMRKPPRMSAINPGHSA